MNRATTQKQGAYLFPRARAYGQVLPSQRVLVALLPTPRDWEIVQNEGWYRIPKRSAPTSNYSHIAFYFGAKSFGNQAWQIARWASLRSEKIVSRRDLFPEAFHHPRANELYLKLEIGELKTLPRPIVSRRARFLVFLSTTLEKLHGADELNDLWHESPLEDEMWSGLKAEGIEAERQWRLKAGRRNYCLDFAVFCAQGGLNIECDGDSYHTDAEKSREDNIRNNALTGDGWAVLRFNTRQIVGEMSACLREVREVVSGRGGVQECAGGVRFPAAGEDGARQMRLF